jgi:uncharacterized membrane protein YedE/YeeE
MKNNIVALLVGLLFALGLGISGMSRPEKVFGFLDILGRWDASLMFVMIGAILVHFVANKMIRKKATPIFDSKFYVPTNRNLNYSLFVGSFTFGVGWALGGYCPGPAFTSLMSFQPRPLIFIVSMVFGMFVYSAINSHFNKKRS